MESKKELDAFVGVIGEIKRKIDLLDYHFDNHMDVSPEEVTWVHVSSAEHISDMLETIIQFTNIQPETVQHFIQKEA